jgi:hypothetical protein
LSNGSATAELAPPRSRKPSYFKNLGECARPRYIGRPLPILGGLTNCVNLSCQKVSRLAREPANPHEPANPREPAPAFARSTFGARFGEATP